MYLFKIFLILLSFKCFFSYSQNNVFGQFKGESTINNKQIESKDELNGKFSFKSYNEITALGNHLNFKNLKITGNYLNGNKHNQWVYVFKNKLIKDVYLNDNTLKLEQKSVVGYNENFVVNYNQNTLNGIVKYTKNLIETGKKTIISEQTILNYNNDTIVGRFYINTKDLLIKGETNKAGFLQGKLTIEYEKNNQKIIENRMYDDGFLVSLDKYNATTKTKDVEIKYDDVVERLKIAKNNPKENISEPSKYFGVLFSKAYPSKDPKRTEQIDANYLIEKHLKFFDTISKIDNKSLNKTPTILKLTRRFKYNNTSIAIDKIKSLFEQLKETQNLLNTVIDNPKINLRKDNSEELSIIYIKSQNLSQKSKKLSLELEKIISGHFDYRSIENYYAKGIEGFTNYENINYIFQNTEKQITSDLKTTIVDFVNFENKIYLISNEIIENAKNYESKVKSLIKNYESVELISTKEAIIIEKKNIVNEKYNFFTTDSDVKQLDFHAKLFHSFKERVFNVNIEKINNDKTATDDKLKVSQETICLYDFFINNHDILTKYSHKLNDWNENFFTKYTDNPFDIRPFETKVLANIQNASLILFRQYSTAMLNEKSCEGLNEFFNKVDLLEKRVIYLTQNYNNPKVIALNKALRREVVPARLEKLLEL